jgi:hypothetical protein
MSELILATILWATLAIIATAESVDVMLDIAYSVTGFCLGFMVALWLYRNGTRDGGRDGP